LFDKRRKQQTTKSAMKSAKMTYPTTRYGTIESLPRPTNDGDVVVVSWTTVANNQENPRPIPNTIQRRTIVGLCSSLTLVGLMCCILWTGTWFHHGSYVSETSRVEYLLLPLEESTTAEASNNSRSATTFPKPTQPRRSLLLLRHAESSWEEFNKPNSTLTDFERPLAPQGIQAARRLGKWLRTHTIIEPEMIFVSPSVRTQATLTLVQESSWAQHVPIVLDQALNDMAPTSYLDYIRSIQATFHRILVVGHNPALFQLVAHDLVIMTNHHNHNKSKKFSKLLPGTFVEFQWNHLSTWSQLGNSSSPARLVLYVPPLP
jgi:phosphohistidine phosphatase SixA